VAHQAVAKRQRHQGQLLQFPRGIAQKRQVRQFWGLIVAVLLFGLGGGVSFYEGVQHIGHPVERMDATWNYIALAAAALIEGTSLGNALRQFLKQKGIA